MEALTKIQARYSVPLSLLSEAHRCRKDQACLSDPNFRLCGVEYVERGAATVLLCASDKACPYSAVVGRREVCTCPVRHEIARKYNV